MAMTSSPLLVQRRGSSGGSPKKSSRSCFLLAVIWFSIVVTVFVSFLLLWAQDDHDEIHLQHHHPLHYHRHQPLVDNKAKSTIAAAAATVVIPGDASSSNSHVASTTDKDPCQKEYERVNDNTHNLTLDDYDRSRALVGNRYRLSNLALALRDKQQKPLNVVVCGGSISLGHGVEPVSMRYSDRLQYWLNAKYPITGANNKKHIVSNKGAHGADMCAMSKRMQLLIQDLPPNPDLFVLEFAVNDYQGQDHSIHIDHKTDVFFDGFEKLALCCEIVIYKLLSVYPSAAIMFIEFQTGITQRKTAALLHMGIAKHYQIPVISYAETMFPDFYQLKHLLKQYNYSTATLSDGSSAVDPVLPYPHGCAPCLEQHIIPIFREFGCKPLCIFAQRSGEFNDQKNCLHPNNGRQPCYVSFLSHDAVHPSAVGHQIATDLIVHAISTTVRDICYHGQQTYSNHALPTVGFMVEDPTKLQQYSDFVLVEDTMQFFAKQHPLEASQHSSGFQLIKDAHDRIGWVATNPKGGEILEFQIDLPKSPCYAMYVAVLKSYEKVGTFNVTVTDLVTKKVTANFFDALWKPRISIPSDIQVTKDTVAGCTGKCKVTVTTHPQLPGRKGNQVKVVTLSARKCISKQQ